jgi:uncharacterized protein (TIGR02300 family)
LNATASNLGRKFTCFKCSCKFYDLNRAEPLCPRCGADQREDPNPDPREAFLSRFRRPSSASRHAKKVKEVTPEESTADGDLGLGDEMLDEDFDADAEGEMPEGMGDMDFDDEEGGGSEAPAEDAEE